jgi:hypothetical protein
MGGWTHGKSASTLVVGMAALGLAVHERPFVGPPSVQGRGHGLDTLTAAMNRQNMSFPARSRIPELQ